MPIVPLTLPLGSAPGRDGVDGAARLINAYAEQVGEGGKKNVAIYCIDGLTRFATCGTGGVRNFLAMSDNELLVTVGRRFWRVDQAGAATAIGAVATDGLVTSARNRASPPDAVIVADGNVLHYSSGVITDLSDPDLTPPNSVFQLSGYFVFTMADGGYRYTDVDTVTVDGLDFQAGSSDGRGIVRGYARGQDGLLFGPRSTRCIQDVGGGTGETFGITTTMPIGLLSAYGVCDVDQTVAFLAHDGTVRILNGYQAEPISTHEVERLIAADASPDQISLAGWTARGHTFVAVSGTNWTRVYDAKTQKWHDRTSYNASKWRCGSAVQFGTKRIFGHHSSPYLYVSDPAVQTEDDEPLVWTVQMAPTHGFPSRMQVATLYADVIAGQGLATGASQDIDPSLMYSHSDDGGHTWSTERQVPVGAQGQRLTRVAIRRLGTIPHTGRTHRLSQSAAVVRGLMGVSIDATKLGT